jgi:hypothetical protein
MRLPKPERAIRAVRHVLRRIRESTVESPSIRVLDVVAPVEDVAERGLRRGQVGTVVETLAPGGLDVGFSDDEGRTYATLALRADQLIVLHYQPVQVG